MPRHIRSRKEILLSAAGGTAAMKAETLPPVVERAGSPFNLRPAVTGSDRSRKRVRGALFSDSAAQDLPEGPSALLASYVALESCCEMVRGRRQLPTFEALCGPVQAITGRRFTKRHLAQICTIVPSVLALEPVFLREPTKGESARWELKIQFLPPTLADVADNGVLTSAGGDGGSGDMAVRKSIFGTRLRELLRLYSKVEDIPEAPLPSPLPPSILPQLQPPSPAVHVRSPSPSPQKKHRHPPSPIPRFQDPHSPPTPSSSSPLSSKSCHTLTSPPTHEKRGGKVGVVSAAVRSPRRTLFPDTESSGADVSADVSMGVGAGLGSRGGEEEVVMEVEESDAAILRNLPLDLILSVKRRETRLAMENSEEAKRDRLRAHRVGALPLMIDILGATFARMQRSVVGRGELVATILGTYPKATDREEVEGQLELLADLAPEWVVRKMSKKGDQLFKFVGSMSAGALKKRVLATTEPYLHNLRKQVG